VRTIPGAYLDGILSCPDDNIALKRVSPGGETECQYLSSRQYSELRQVPIISNVAAAFCRAVCNNFPPN
jgi:hypothetical protein